MTNPAPAPQPDLRERCREWLHEHGLLEYANYEKEYARPQDLATFVEAETAALQALVEAQRTRLLGMRRERDEARGQVKRLEKECEEWCHTIEKVISAAKGWWREFDMYRTAWLREIGGIIRCKTHEIDGFVLRTRDIYEAYQREQKALASPHAAEEGKL